MPRGSQRGSLSGVTDVYQKGTQIVDREGKQIFSQTEHKFETTPPFQCNLMHDETMQGNRMKIVSDAGFFTSCTLFVIRCLVIKLAWQKKFGISRGDQKWRCGLKFVF